MTEDQYQNLMGLFEMFKDNQGLEQDFIKDTFQQCNFDFDLSLEFLLNIATAEDP